MCSGLLMTCNLHSKETQQEKSVTLNQLTEQKEAQINENIDDETISINAAFKTVSANEALSQNQISEVSVNTFVEVTDYIPSIMVELKYSTNQNFTGQKIYDFDEAYLRYGTVQKLIQVQNDLSKHGLGMIIWDAYRPVKAQFKLWEICPDGRYVANPNKGYSSHSRGNTVDVSIVKLTDKIEVEMPSEFDDFTKKADRKYDDCSETAAKNAKLLETIMKQNGFMPYENEWWHYTDATSYPIKEQLDISSL